MLLVPDFRVSGVGCQVLTVDCYLLGVAVGGCCLPLGVGCLILVVDCL
jgi:hypothetical protein